MFSSVNVSRLTRRSILIALTAVMTTVGIGLPGLVRDSSAAASPPAAPWLAGRHAGVGPGRAPAEGDDAGREGRSDGPAAGDDADRPQQRELRRQRIQPAERRLHAEDPDRPARRFGARRRHQQPDRHDRPGRCRQHRLRLGQRVQHRSSSTRSRTRGCTSRWSSASTPCTVSATRGRRRCSRSRSAWARPGIPLPLRPVAR